jgi:archaellum component FlaC
MSSNNDEKLKAALDGMKDHASSITEVLDSYKKKVEELEQLRREAEEKAAKAEEKAKNAEEQHAQALKKLGQVEARESTNYAPLIKELFKEPQQELQRHVQNQSRWFMGVSLAVAVLAILVSVSVTSYYSSQRLTGSHEITAASPDELEAKLIQAITHLDEKTQKSIDKISLDTAKIVNDINYIAKERRIVDQIAKEIDKFQNEFGPVSSRNDVRLLYKMRLSPQHKAKYVLFHEAMKKSNLPTDLIPTNLNDFYIWDRQMLHIFQRLRREVDSVKQEYGQIPNEILRFSNYKDRIDATKYGVWSIEIEDYSQLVRYVEKQIDRYKKQILINNKEI